MKTFPVLLMSLIWLSTQINMCQFLPLEVWNRDVQKLTSEKRRYSWPRWSPDGARIVYQVDLGPAESQIFILGSDGSNIRRNTDITKNGWDPDWSPDGSKIVFASNMNGTGQLFLMDNDGGNITQLTQGTHTADCPKWSPNGKHIAFCTALTGDLDDTQIYLVNADGTNITALTKFPLGNIFRFEWSPDSSQIVFVAQRVDLKRSGTRLGQYGPFLYVMNSDGSNVKQIEGSSGYMSPTWSPNGTSILYTFLNVNAQNLMTDGFYMIKSDGSDRRFLFREGCDYPNWSRTINRVVFTCGGAMYDGSIYTMDMENIVR